MGKTKEWICPNKECNKTFAHKQSLNNHKTCGFGFDELPCNACFKKFTRITYLKKHKKQCKGLVTKVKDCQVCGKQFSTPWHLERHIPQKHTNECAEKQQIDIPFSNYATFFEVLTKSCDPSPSTYIQWSCTPNKRTLCKDNRNLAN